MAEFLDKPPCELNIERHTIEIDLFYCYCILFGIWVIFNFGGWSVLQVIHETHQTGRKTVLHQQSTEQLQWLLVLTLTILCTHTQQWPTR